MTEGKVLMELTVSVEFCGDTTRWNLTNSDVIILYTMFHPMIVQPV